jgi:rubrerythrin
MMQGLPSSDEGSGADYVRFWPAGQSAKGEFHCSECGYGVAVYRALPRCPMCGGEAWEQASWSPFGRALDAYRQ